MADRSQALLATLNCRSASASSTINCASATYICGATCTSSGPLTNVSTELHFASGHATSRNSVWLHGFVGIGIDDAWAAAMTCSNGSVVDVSGRFSSNYQAGPGAAAIYVNSANLTVSFSKVHENVKAIYARAQSTLSVTHTEFYQNEAQPNIANSSSSITCESSTALVTNSRFSHNRGQSIVLFEGSTFAMLHSAIHDNDACDEHGLTCARTSGITIGGGSTASIRTSLFFKNRGSLAGAILVTGTGTKLSAASVVLYSNRGVSRERVGGAMLVADSAVAELFECKMDNNLGTAPVAAGAVMVGSGAVLMIRDSQLQYNKAQGNPTLVQAAGAIMSEEHAHVSVHGSNMTGNEAADSAEHSAEAFANDFHALSPERAYVIDTLYEPFDDTLSVLIVPGVARGKMRGSCQEYPCQPGYGCHYKNASLQWYGIPSNLLLLVMYRSFLTDCL